MAARAKKVRAVPEPVTTLDDQYSEGIRFFTLKKFALAQKSFSAALVLSPDHLESRVYLSKCLMNLGHLEEAMSEVDSVLKKRPNHTRAIYQKGDTLYRMKKFEASAVYFSRGLHMRPTSAQFKHGLRVAKEAIDNCIGEQMGQNFDEIRNIIPKVEIDLNLVLYPTDTPKDKMKTKNAIRRVLNQLHPDLVFLESLLEHPTIRGVETFTKPAEETLEFLDVNKELFAHEMPLYARRNKVIHSTKRLTQWWETRRRIIESEYQDKIQIIRDQLDKFLGTMKENLMDRKPVDVVRDGLKALTIIKKKKEKYIPDKSDYLCSIWGLMGHAYEDHGDYEKAMMYHVKFETLAEESERLDLRVKALTNIGKAHARFKKYKKAVEVWETAIPLLELSEEKAWLFHEIGRCYYEIDKLEASRLYARRAVEEAMTADSPTWCLNASVLLAQTEFRLGRIDKAKLALADAENYATVTNNLMALNYVHKTMIELEKL